FDTTISFIFSSLYYAYLYIFFFFFFNDPSPTEIYTLSLHDALPISAYLLAQVFVVESYEPLPFLLLRIVGYLWGERNENVLEILDRKSTRLNSSHDQISYAVFCLKKKKKII